MLRSSTEMSYNATTGFTSVSGDRSGHASWLLQPTDLVSHVSHHTTAAWLQRAGAQPWSLCTHNFELMHLSEAATAVIALRHQAWQVAK
jgi:hypothetical protein